MTYYNILITTPTTSYRIIKKIKIINQEIANDTFNSMNLLEKNRNLELFQKLIFAMETSK